LQLDVKKEKKKYLKMLEIRGTILKGKLERTRKLAGNGHSLVGLGSSRIELKGKARSALAQMKLLIRKKKTRDQHANRG